MSKKKFAVYLIVLSLIATLIYFEMTRFAPERIKVRFETVESERVPASFDGSTIGFISDVYGAEETFDRAIQMLKDFNPDVIVFGGNLFDEKATDAQKNHYIEQLSGLKPLLGKYSVLGIDDIKKHAEDTATVLSKSGFRMVANSTVPLHNQSDEFIQLVGLDATNDLNPGEHFTYPDVNPEVFNLTIANNPGNIEFMKATTVDVMLAGKTLGGQVRLPLVGSLTDDSPYIHHRERIDETTLIVSSGVGLREPKLRLFSHPDVTILVLKNPQK